MRLRFRSLGLGSVGLSRIATFSSMDIFFAVSEIIDSKTCLANREKHRIG